MKTLQVTISTTHNFSELVSLALIENGSEGVNIVDHKEMQSILKNESWDYVDESLFLESDEVVLVSGFFDLDFDTSVIEKELAKMKAESDEETGSLEINSIVIDSASWEDVWKQYYVPIKIGKITIVPKWIDFKSDGTIPVFINPGLAFGTGMHETTSMVIELLNSIILEGLQVADVGCGSGILGLTALKLGADNCTFIDNDNNAIRSAKENLDYNNLYQKSILIEENLLKGTKTCYDVILANLTADLLILLYDGLKNSLKREGQIIVSGIIDKRLNEIEQLFKNGFKTEKTLTKGEWHAILLRKID